MMLDYTGWMASYDAMIKAADKLIKEGARRMISYETAGTIAAQLFDGGWRPEDRDWLKSYYELTDGEADEIIAMLESDM